MNPDWSIKFPARQPYARLRDVFKNSSWTLLTFCEKIIVLQTRESITTIVLKVFEFFNQSLYIVYSCLPYTSSQLANQKPFLLSWYHVTDLICYDIMFLWTNSGTVNTWLYHFNTLLRHTRSSWFGLSIGILARLRSAKVRTIAGPNKPDIISGIMA